MSAITRIFIFDVEYAPRILSEDQIMVEAARPLTTSSGVLPTILYTLWTSRRFRASISSRSPASRIASSWNHKGLAASPGACQETAF